MPEIELPEHKELIEHSRHSFSKGVALVTAFYAIILAITSLGGSNAMKEMILSQQEASDQWAYYQSKAIRQHMYKQSKVQIEAALLERAQVMKPEALKRYKAILAKSEEEENRFEKEKEEIKKHAEGFEHERNVYRRKDPYFDYAEGLLQISIVMASVSILSNSRPVFYFSLVTSLLGTLLMLNGFTLLVKLPILG